MVDVKPDEISAILKQQLSGFKSETDLEEIGTVLQVGDGIARIYGLTKAQANELIEFETGVQAIVLNLEEDNVGAVLLGTFYRWHKRRRLQLKVLGRIASVPGWRRNGRSCCRYSWGIQSMVKDQSIRR